MEDLILHRLLDQGLVIREGWDAVGSWQWSTEGKPAVAFTLHKQCGQLRK